MAALPVILVVVVLLCLVSIVVIPGAVLLAVPLAVILGVVLVMMLVRGAAASRGGTRMESDDVGAAVGDALAPPEQERERDEAAEQSRSRTQG